MLFKINHLMEIFNKVINLMFMVTLDERIPFEIRKEYSVRIKDIKNEMEELVDGNK